MTNAFKSVFNATEALLHAIFGDLTPNGKFWAYIFLMGSVFACYMSFDFGRNTSFVHGGMLAIITVCAGLGWHEAHKRFEKRAFLTCLFTALACVPLQGFEFITHSGYAAGFRGESVTLARVQNARYDTVQKAVGNDQVNLDMWRDQLKTLEGEKATLVKANEWAPTIKAEALRDELKSLNDRMAEEEKGKRGRAAGKGKEFERLNDAAIAVSKKISTIERLGELDGQIEAKTKQIQATQKILDSKSEVATKTDKVSSAVEQADNFMARAVGFVQTGSLKATAEGEDKAHFGLNIAMALTTTIGTAFAALMAGMNRRKADEPAVLGPAKLVEAPKSAPLALVEPQKPVVREIVRNIERVVHTDPRSMFAMRSQNRQCA
jgi:hypothetical protein